MTLTEEKSKTINPRMPKVEGDFNFDAGNINAQDIQRLNEIFEEKTLLERLQFLVEHFKDDLGMTSAFGYSGMILMNFFRELFPELPIYFLDTRFHFESTMKFVDSVKCEWKLNIIKLSPEKSEEEIQVLLGKKPFEKNPDVCCSIRKVEPLQKILPVKKMWIHALRRDQSLSRKDIDFVEEDSRGFVKIYPLADWKREQCWDFIRSNEILYHPMHDDNYPSIGCWPCTQQVQNKQKEREGRWVSFPKMECGIHERSKKKQS